MLDISDNELVILGELYTDYRYQKTVLSTLISFSKCDKSELINEWESLTRGYRGLYAHK